MLIQSVDQHNHFTTQVVHRQVRFLRSNGFKYFWLNTLFIYDVTSLSCICVNFKWRAAGADVLHKVRVISQALKLPVVCIVDDHSNQPDGKSTNSDHGIEPFVATLIHRTIKEKSLNLGENQRIVIVKHSATATWGHQSRTNWQQYHAPPFNKQQQQCELLCFS